MIRFGETETQQLPTPIRTEEVRVLLCPYFCMVDALPVLRVYRVRLTRAGEICLSGILRVRHETVACEQALKRKNPFRDLKDAWVLC